MRNRVPREGRRRHSEQRAFGRAIEFVEAYSESRSRTAQQGAGDWPFVPFDEVQVRRRNADRTRQIRLGYAQAAPALANAHSEDRTGHYTAPTAIRALMGQGREWVDAHDLSSLRILGSVGEPINPEAWSWYDEVVGKGRCPIVDTWWQTETGGILITPLPGAIPTKPGSATKPFFGVRPVVLDPTSGAEITDDPCEGVLCIADSWPGQMRTVWGDHARFVDTYFSQYKGTYFTGRKLLTAASTDNDSRAPSDASSETRQRPRSGGKEALWKDPLRSGSQPIRTTRP